MAAARISFATRQRSQNLLFRRLQFLPAGRQSSHRRVRCNVSTNAVAGTQDLLFKVSGRDRLGVVGQFCEILAIHDAVILDVEQAACTVHSTFSLNLLARCRTGDGTLIQSMVAKAQDFQLQIGTTVIQGSPGLRADGEPGMRFALTLEATNLRYSQLAAVGVAAENHGLSIERIQRLSPIVEPLDGEQKTALHMVLEAGGTPSNGDGGFQTSGDIDGFINAVKQSTTHDTYLFLREEHAPGRPGFTEPTEGSFTQKHALLELRRE